MCVFHVIFSLYQLFRNFSSKAFFTRMFVDQSIIADINLTATLVTIVRASFPSEFDRPYVVCKVDGLKVETPRTGRSSAPSWNKKLTLSVYFPFAFLF